MNDIRQWLEGLGLGQYASVFAENHIDLTLARTLTNQDLRDLGIASLGHRKRLLQAIAALTVGAPSGGVPSSAPSGPPAADLLPAPATPPAPAAEAERRQVTVLFADLAGSTALSVRFDPEDIRELLCAYQEICAEAIARCDGFLAQYLGDGVLAYFGYPQAREDAAERAVHAGRRIVKAVRRLCTPEGESVQARVGIATGLVVVGDTHGGGVTQDQAVVGETPNLAARLQSQAPPGSVVIAAATRRLVGDAFAYEDLGERSLKGFAEPVRLWRVIGRRLGQSRFDAVHGAGATALVGRDQELALLLDRWQSAKGGEGQAVFLSGEAGIGKSRLAETLYAHIAAEPHYRIRYQCLPYHGSSALHPAVIHLASVAGIRPEDPPASKLDKLEALIREAGTDIVPTAPLLAALLSIPDQERYAEPVLTPQQLREATLEALVGQLLALAAQRPVLLVVEDVHWIDPTTADLIDRALARIGAVRVLAVITFRPDYVPPWTGYPHITALTLSRLGRDHCRRLMEQVAADRLLPPGLADQIVAKADGVPLFVEELTKSVLESGLIEPAADGSRTGGPSAPAAIPATLHDSLMARLDRLGPVKEVAQISAAIGREIPYPLLATVVDRDDAGLHAALDRLVDAGLLFRRGMPPDAVYTFKHALVQDAAYASLVRVRRQRLHARIAAALAERFPHRAEDEPEVLARHFALAGDPGRAVDYWQRAGDRALRHSANLEAIDHLNRGLEALAALPDDENRARRELRLLTSLSPALIATKGYTAPETRAVNLRTRQRAKHLGDRSIALGSYYGEWVYHFVGGHLHEAYRLAETWLADPGVDADPAERILGLRQQAHILTCYGEFPAARDMAERALAFYDHERFRDQALICGIDPGSGIFAYYAIALWHLGQTGAARQAVERAIANAEAFGHVFNLAFARCVGGCLFATITHDWDWAERAGPAARAFCEEHRVSQLSGFATLALAAGQAHHPAAGRDDARRAATLLTEGIERWRSAGGRLFVPHFLCVLAGVQVLAGDTAAARAALDEASALMEETGERMSEADLHRLHGDILSLEGAAAAAEEAYHEAMMIAGRQQSALLELRSATSLARLRERRGRRRSARDLLADCLGRIADGSAAPDVRAAETLLRAYGRRASSAGH